MPAAVLTHNSYGKSLVRLTKVIHRGDVHDLIELSANIALEGDFAAAYESGDNRKVIATDSMKNTVYVLAREKSFDSIEEFAVLLARHLAQTYPQVARAIVELEQTLWQRINVDGKPHQHSFVAGGSDRRTCKAIVVKPIDKVELTGGIAGLLVLKTTASEFSAFVRDRYTTLPDTTDRIFATSVDAVWPYTQDTGDFNSAYDAIRQSLLETFATHHSLGVQQTLLAMGEAALAACAAIKSIELTMPNKHRLLANLKPFGLENRNEVFVPTDEPHGLISGTVERG
jgi:urate oxidase